MGRSSSLDARLTIHDQNLKIVVSFRVSPFSRPSFPLLLFFRSSTSLPSLASSSSRSHFGLSMEASVMTDTLSATAQSLCLAKSLFYRSTVTAGNNILLVTDSPSDHTSSSSSAPGPLQLSAVIFPIDALAPPPVRSKSRTATAARTLLKKRRRTKIRPSSDSGGSEDDGFSGGSDGGDDGPFGGGSGGGSGWNSDGSGRGGSNWDDSSKYHSDPAFDFVYEVVCWIVFSNCLHFAFKKIVRWVGEGLSVNEREKVPMRLASVC